MNADSYLIANVIHNAKRYVIVIPNVVCECDMQSEWISEFKCDMQCAAAGDKLRHAGDDAAAGHGKFFR